MKARSQKEHRKINAREYPGTRQLCVICEESTERCEEDALYANNGEGPLCDKCYDKREEVMKKQKLTIREACQQRIPLDGIDAQALEHALTRTENERDAYKRDYQAEISGNKALREDYGACEGEGMIKFVMRLAKERDKAQAEVVRLEAALRKIGKMVYSPKCV